MYVGYVPTCLQCLLAVSSIDSSQQSVDRFVVECSPCTEYVQLELIICMNYWSLCLHVESGQAGSTPSICSDSTYIYKQKST